MISKATFTVFSIILLFFFSTAAVGQGTTGSIAGTVSDQAGGKIPGATVTVESTATTAGFERTVTTDENGYFVIAGLLPGDYKVTFGATGFHKILQNVNVRINKTTIISPVLEVQPAMIHPDFETIYPGETMPDTNLTKNTITRLPQGTTFGSILKYAPNTRAEPLAGGFQIDGGSGSDNVFLIDGQEVTNYRTGILNSNNRLPLELIQEVQIKTSGFESEYGGATGGVVNIATIGGNDTLRGNFGISFRPENWQGSPRPVLNRYGGAGGQFEFFKPNKDKGIGYFPYGSVSGPVIKEKLWFSAIYAPQIYNTRRTIDYFATGASPVNRTVTESVEYKATVRTEAAFVRLDAQPVSTLRFFGTFLWNPIIQDGLVPSNTEGFNGVPQQIGSLRGAELLRTQGGRQNSNTVNGQISWTPTDKVLVNVRAGRSFMNENLNSYGIPDQTRFLCSTSGSPETVPGSNCSRGFQNIASNYNFFYNSSERTTFDANLNLVGIRAAGYHNFKGGYQYNHLFGAVSEGYANTGIVVLYYGRDISFLGIPVTSTPGNLGSGFLQRFGKTADADNTAQALYVRDSWQIRNRLTLDLGIRFENENVPNFGINQNLKFGWRDKIAPRIGAAFDLTGDGKTKIFAGYGRFYDRLKYEMPYEAFPGTFFRDYFEILPSRGAAYTNYTFSRIIGGDQNATGSVCPIMNGSGWSVCRFDFNGPVVFPTIFPSLLIDPDLKPTRQTDLTVGFERELGYNFVLSGRYTRKKLENVIEDVNIFNEQGSQDYRIGNPGQDFICQISDPTLPCPKPVRKYDAVEIALDKRAPRFFFNTSYTWSRLYGNYSGLANADELGRTSPNVTRAFDLPNSAYNANGEPAVGRLPTDRPHVFKAYGGYTFDWADNFVNRTTVSAFTTFQSGTPLTTVYTLYASPNSVLYGRGDLGRTGMYSETDLAVRHRYLFGRDNRFAFEPFVEILNLFDEKNVISAQTAISSTDFRASTLTASGCPNCSGQFGVYYTIFNQGGIGTYIRNFLNLQGTSSAGRRNDYGQPNLFQLPRDLRFGFRFFF